MLSCEYALAMHRKKLHMKIILFGATGMVGQGVLRECRLDPEIKTVLVVGRTPLNQQSEKLQEIVFKDLYTLAPIEDQLRGYDACFFCLGVSSAGMKEADYQHVTYDLTLGVAQTLAKLNPEITATSISGLATASTENGRSMGARVKGKTENAFPRLPFKTPYLLRPAFVYKMYGIKSKAARYRL